jgi:hypothetical protein
MTLAMRYFIVKKLCIDLTLYREGTFHMHISFHVGFPPELLKQIRLKMAIKTISQSYEFTGYWNDTFLPLKLKLQTFMDVLHVHLIRGRSSVMPLPVP